MDSVFDIFACENSIVTIVCAKMYFSLCVLFPLLLPVKTLYVGESCIAENQAGTCTLISKCQHLLDMIASAGRPIPRHIGMKLMERSCGGFEGNDPIVCCTPPSGDKKTNTDDDSGALTRYGGEIPDIRDHKNLRLLPTRTCGVEDSFRIMEGNRTGILEMPWMVLLSYDTPRGSRSSCGGTLINDRYVLTAAHCVVGMGNKKKFSSVILGEWDTRRDPDCERVGEDYHCVPSAKNVSVEEIIIHKEYYQLRNDIALLRLSEAADVESARIRPVCLPVTPELQNEDLNGQMGVVSGWGAADDGLQSPVLLYVELPIVGNKECQDAYMGQPPIYSSQICAGGVINKDTCAGDSGGPLLFYGTVAGTKGTRYVQRGIVSYGSRTCGIGLPSVYTRTAYYMDWILDHIHE